LDVKIWTSIDASDALDDFDVKVLIFQNNMWSKVVKVIKPFFAISSSLWWPSSSQYVGHYVWSLFQKFEGWGKLCGMWGLHSSYIWIWCKCNNSIDSILMIVFEILNPIV